MHPEPRITKEVIDGKLIYVCHTPIYTHFTPQVAKVPVLLDVLKNYKRAGIIKVACYDTRVSRTGLTTTLLAEELGMHCTIFFPAFTVEQTSQLNSHHAEAAKHNADIRYIAATNPKVLHYERAALLAARDGLTMLPWGLTGERTVAIYAERAEQLPYEVLGGTVVLCVGSGMNLCGLLKGAPRLKTVIGITVGLTEGLRERVTQLVPNHSKYWLVKSDYSYYEASRIPGRTLEFGCDPHYGRKALEWAVDHYSELDKPVVFYNLG
jgi:hypothetical protein